MQELCNSTNSTISNKQSTPFTNNDAVQSAQINTREHVQSEMNNDAVQSAQINTREHVQSEMNSRLYNIQVSIKHTLDTQ